MGSCEHLLSELLMPAQWAGEGPPGQGVFGAAMATQQTAQTKDREASRYCGAGDVTQERRRMWSHNHNQRKTREQCGGGTRRDAQ